MQRSSEQCEELRALIGAIKQYTEAVNQQTSLLVTIIRELAEQESIEAEEHGAPPTL